MIPSNTEEQMTALLLHLFHNYKCYTFFDVEIRNLKKHKKGEFSTTKEKSNIHPDFFF